MGKPYDLQAHEAGVTAYFDLLDNEDECSCENCVVRVVLEAAYPHLRTLVLAEEGPSAAAIPRLAAVVQL